MPLNIGNGRGKSYGKEGKQDSREMASVSKGKAVRKYIVDRQVVRSMQGSDVSEG
jgi:hypothetical protein